MKIKTPKAVIRDVEAETGYEFTDEEIEEIKKYTRRKCAMNHKKRWYFPLLLEDELKNYIIRNAISEIGRLNRCAKFVGQTLA